MFSSAKRREVSALIKFIGCQVFCIGLTLLLFDLPHGLAGLVLFL